MPDDFMKSWYQHWGALEEWLALELEKERKKQIATEIDYIEMLIKNFRDSSSSP